MKIMFFLIFIYLAEIYLVSTNPNDTAHEDCPTSINEMKRKSAFLSNRFKDNKLDAICKKRNQWKELKAKPVTIKNYTTGQSEFIDKVRKCRGKNCLQKKSHNKPNEKSSTKLRRSVRDDGLSMSQRKEYRSLTDDERNLFHSALNQLKTDMIDGVSKYDLLVGYHLPSTAPGAHWGCSFVPWHREFLKQMEVALRWEVNDTFLPYWDSTLDEGLPNPCDSILWSDAFMGNSKGQVTTGPFASWTTTDSIPGTNDNKLYRECGSADGDMFEPGDIDYIMTKNVFQDVFCYCDEPTFETAHGLVHVFVGGHMNYIPLSPNDPIFFMHHAFIDYLWEQWRQAKQTRYQRETDYPSDDMSCGPDYYATAPMQPFPDLLVKDGLSNNYTDQLYTYAQSPSCPLSCTGPYLFCNIQAVPPRCLSKIVSGGNCTGFVGQDACYGGTCTNNVCV